ncbi:MAG: hypothetical protein HY680_05070 [Chloroflexi bacterium]|nr:hypothetical protein [Chloroflexota bacterium]
MFRRFLRALQFDRSLYQELQDDPAAIVQAVGIMMLVSLALAAPGITVYQVGRNPVLVILWSLAFNLTQWFVFSLLGYLPSRYLIKRGVTFGSFLRIVGFALAPGVFSVFLSLGGGAVALLFNAMVILWVLVGIIVAYLRVMGVSILAAFPMAVMGMFVAYNLQDLYTWIFF